MAAWPRLGLYLGDQIRFWTQPLVKSEVREILGWLIFGLPVDIFRS